jgi:hypothetical protein
MKFKRVVVIAEERSSPMSDIQETTQYDVNLPKPRTRKVLIGALIAVLVLAAVGVAAAAIANLTAQSPGDATAGVMPANTVMYFSLNTHADQLPNFNVIADAWKDSKQAKMLASGLQLGLMQAGINWEDDVQPWLGERAALGIVDLGGMDQTQADQPHYRAPSLVVAAQTKDRAKSDAALTSALEQISQSSGGSIETETYRGIPVTYLKSSDDRVPETGAFATIDDVVVLTLGKEQLHKAIDAAHDGQNMSTHPNYVKVMSALPAQNAGAMYLDYNRYFELLMEMNKSVNQTLDSLYSGLDDAQAKEFMQQREQMQRQQEAQLAQLQEMMKALGGMGAAMSYEPTGIRFDTVMQYDPAQLPADQRQLYESALSPASGRMFATLPASTILAADFSLKGGFLKAVLNPDVLAAQLATLGMSAEDITGKLNDFQKLIGVNLQTDVFDLMDGDAGLAIMLRDQQKSDGMSYAMPIELALLFDSSDANKLMQSFDKVLQSLSVLSGEKGLTTQSLSGLPYSVVMADRMPVLTYGVVDGRFVIGTDSNTLLGIDNGDQASLAGDAAFKQATGLLPANRLNTAYFNFQPLWNLINSQAGGDSDAAGVLNYLSHFKWIATGAEAPADGLSRGSMHVGVGQ